MTIDLHTPTCWQEVSAEQLHDVMELANQGLRREEGLLIMLCKFAGIKMVISKKAEEKKHDGVRQRFKDAEGHVFELENWQVSDFCGRLAFLWDEDLPLDANWPFAWNRYLLDTTFGDWFHADALILGFSMSGNIEQLKGAMKDLGDPHPDLQPNSPDVVLMLKWYELFKEWLQEKYPLVLQKSDPTSGTASSYDPIEARQNIMLMLNDGKPQDNEAIERSNMHDVLAALQHKIEEAQRAQKLK